MTATFAVEHTSNAVILCFVFLVFMGGSEGKGNLEYEVRVFLKGGRPPPPLQTHPHTHTMREKRRYNGALRILAVFRGRASQPASRGGGGRGGVSKASQPPRRSSSRCTAEGNRMMLSTLSQSCVARFFKT